MLSKKEIKLLIRQNYYEEDQEVKIQRIKLIWEYLDEQAKWRKSWELDEIQWVAEQLQESLAVFRDTLEHVTKDKYRSASDDLCRVIKAFCEISSKKSQDPLEFKYITNKLWSASLAIRPNYTAIV